MWSSHLDPGIPYEIQMNPSDCVPNASWKKVFRLMFLSSGVPGSAIHTSSTVREKPRNYTFAETVSVWSVVPGFRLLGTRTADLRQPTALLSLSQLHQASALP